MTTERWRMRVLGLGTTEWYHAPLWLQAFDVDAHDGRGFTQLTPHAADALVFPSCDAVLSCWKQPSNVRPLRDDGRPNRPVSAYTIQPERIPE